MAKDLTYPEQYALPPDPDEEAIQDDDDLEVEIVAEHLAPPPMVPPFSDPAYQVLLERLRGGKLVLCTGAALGAEIGLPTWREIVEELLDRLPPEDEVDQARDLLRTRPLIASAFVKRRLGPEFLHTLAQVVPRPGQAPLPETAQFLGRLPFRAVLTTAFDDIADRAFAQDGPAPRVYTAFDADEIRRESRGRYVLHLLGSTSQHDPDATTPAERDDIIFGAADLQRLLRNDSFRHVTHELFHKRSFLLVGFSPDDPDLAILLERMLLGAPQSPSEPDAGPRHFAVLSGLPQIARDDLASAFGIYVLPDEDLYQVAQHLYAAVGEGVKEVQPDDDDVEGWLRFLQQDPGHPEGAARLDALATRLRRAGEPDRVIELLLGRIELEPDAPRRAQCLRQVSEVLERDKGQMAEAFQSMMEAYKEAPSSEILDELERLAGITGQWVELLTALREVIPQLTPAQRAEAWVRMARLYADKLSHLEYALGCLAEAHKLDAGEPSTRQQLRELRVDLTRRAERWKELTDALGVLAAASPEPERKIDLYLEQGDIYETRLSDGVSAAAAFRRALDATPGGSQDALAALEHLLRRHRNWAELVDVLDRKAELLTRFGGTEEDVLSARREAAQIATDNLPDRKQAAARWEEIREHAPRDLDALRALEKIYAQESAGTGANSERYLAVLNDLADLVESEKERLTLYRRLGAEYDELPGHSHKAATAFERVLDIDPGAEDAYRALERLYRQERKWVLLVDTLRRHARHAEHGKAALYAAIGKIYEVEIPGSDPDQLALAAPQAIEAYHEVLHVDPEHAEALAALTRLYQHTEQWSEAIRLLDKRANLADDKADKVALRDQAAQLTAQRLHDPKGAEERFIRALEVDPQHVPTMTALVELYRTQGEYLRAAKLLLEIEPLSQNRLDKTRFLVDAAGLYARTDDPNRAIDLYLKALALDPEHAEAGQRAQELLYRQGRHSEALPILEMLTRKLSEVQPKDQLQHLTRLGQAARAVHDEPKALKAFTRAAELFPNDVTAQRGRGELLLKEKRWQEASEAYTAALQHCDELPASEVVELYYLLGECSRQLQRLSEAAHFYSQALEIDPAHRRSLQGKLLLPALLPAERIEAKRALLGTSGTEEQIQLLTEIGDIQAESLDDPQGALETYREALKLRPDSHILLHKSMDLLIGQKSWVAVLAVLEALIANEKNERRRAKYKHTAALIARDELRDYKRALPLFSGAVDDDPSLAKSAIDLEKLAREQGDWMELARIFKRKIKALGPDTEHSTPEQRAERLRLWNSLGQVALEHLHDGEAALAAFEVAVALDPGQIERRRLLAQLYMQAGPDQADKAIVEHQALLQMNKAELGSYRALKTLYLQVKQREKAAWVAHALHLLRKADAEDDKLVAEMKARPLSPAKRPMKQELWGFLAHPAEDRRVGAIFKAVLPAVQLGNARTFKEAGLNRKDRLSDTAAQLYAKALRYGVEVLDTLVPEGYLQPEQKEQPYTVLHCADKGQPPVLCVLFGAPLLNPKRPEREIMYEIGRLATFLRPNRALRTLLPTAPQLGLILDAAMCLAGDAASMPPKVQETAHGLRRSLTPQLLEQVVSAAKGLRESGARGEIAASEWLGWSDMTAVRAGLVLAGDLETVAVLLATDPPGTSPLSPKQRLLELLHFAVTEEHFTIRQHLGLMG